MKKYLFVLSLVFASMPTINMNAQTEEKDQKSFNLAEDLYGDVGVLLASFGNANAKLGYNAQFGLEIKTPWADDVLLMPAIGISSRNLRQSNDYGSIGTALGTWGGDYKVDLNFKCIDLPIRIGYTTEIMQHSIIPYTGAYFSYAVMGSTESEHTTVTPSGTSKTTKAVNTDIFNDNGFERFDMGWMIGVKGSLSHNWYLQLEYTQGLKDMASTWSKNNNKSSKWGILSISIGFSGFMGKKKF